MDRWVQTFTFGDAHERSSINPKHTLAAHLRPQLPEEEEYDLSDVDLDEDFDKDEL